MGYPPPPIGILGPKILQILSEIVRFQSKISKLSRLWFKFTFYFGTFCSELSVFRLKFGEFGAFFFKMWMQIYTRDPPLIPLSVPPKV